MISSTILVLIVIVFILGYAAIALEHPIKINKTASAILTGVVLWSIYALYMPDKEQVVGELEHQLGEIAGILFFLLGAMTIVELIDLHDGFSVITDKITTQSATKLLLIIGVLTFFLSALLDNLTTTIVMLSLLRKLLPEGEIRLTFAGIIVIAANAGGAWSPIGDVTTTMLWIGGQITTSQIVAKVFLPSLACLALPLLIVSRSLSKKNIAVFDNAIKLSATNGKINGREKNAILFIGLGALIFVPVFKTITHLPPYMGILFGLGILWAATELIHKGKQPEVREQFSPAAALQRIDVPSVLFFLGILTAVGALQSTGILGSLAAIMDESIGNTTIIVIAIGALSAIVDNVPLVAASMAMYPLSQYPTDHYLWQFLAYCAGTGGSMLIIGSAAGVAAMGIEKIEFFWYMKKIGWLALIGYISGILVFLAQDYLFF